MLAAYPPVPCIGLQVVLHVRFLRLVMSGGSDPDACEAVGRVVPGGLAALRYVDY